MTVKETLLSIFIVVFWTIVWMFLLPIGWVAKTWRRIRGRHEVTGELLSEIKPRDIPDDWLNDDDWGDLRKKANVSSELQKPRDNNT